MSAMATKGGPASTERLKREIAVRLAAGEAVREVGLTPGVLSLEKLGPECQDGLAVPLDHVLLLGSVRLRE